MFGLDLNFFLSFALLDSVFMRLQSSFFLRDYLRARMDILISICYARI